MIPWQVREAVSAIRNAPARKAAAKAREGIAKSSEAKPVVAFGGVLNVGSLIHGGAVKLLHLRDAFAHSEQSFNVLYLVSSAQAPFAVDLARLCRDRGIAFVWNQNGVGYPAWAGSEAERHNAPMRELLRLAGHVVYQSTFCRESADKFLGPCPAPHSTLLNPVDLEKFRPPANPLPASPLKLLAMGTQNYAARVLSAIGCLKALRDGGVDATLTIAGKLLWRGAEEDVAREISRFGLSAHVARHPAFTQEEAANLYRAHHIVIHPKYLDPCPTVVIEALASGLPVVGSASGGLPELIPSAAGELVRVPLDWNHLITPSGEEFAAAVSKLLPRLPEAAASARAHAVAHFGTREWIARHREIFESLIA